MKKGSAYAKEVARHYNERPERNDQERKESPIIQLRSFNNYIKSVLLQQYARPDFRVLDLCCGKGGDLQKYRKLRIREMVGVDIADVSIEQAYERYEKGNFYFKAAFYCLDCFKDSLLNAPDWETGFDLVSCQFSLHYAFESETRIRQFLENVSQNLKVGGHFVGTIPNSYWIVKNLKQAEGLSFGNPLFEIRFEQKETFPVYGHKYFFKLEDAIDDCAEFLVHFPHFERLAKEYGMELVLRMPFHEYFTKHQYPDLIDRMRVMDAQGNFPADQWEIAGIYIVFVFKRISKTEAEAEKSE